MLRRSLRFIPPRYFAILDTTRRSVQTWLRSLDSFEGRQGRHPPRRSSSRTRVVSSPAPRPSWLPRLSHTTSRPQELKSTGMMHGSSLSGSPYVRTLHSSYPSIIPSHHGTTLTRCFVSSATH